MTTTLTNVSGETIHIGKVHDRIGGDLESDWNWYHTVLGPLDMYTKGKTEKVFYDFEGDFELANGSSVGFGIWVSPDVNTVPVMARKLVIKSLPLQVNIASTLGLGLKAGLVMNMSKQVPSPFVLKLKSMSKLLHKYRGV